MNSSSVKNLVHWESLLFFFFNFFFWKSYQFTESCEDSSTKSSPVYLSPHFCWWRSGDHNQEIDTDSQNRAFLLPQASFVLLGLLQPLPFHPYLLNLWQLLYLFSIFIILLFQECYLSGITTYVSFEIGVFTQHNSLEIHPGCCVFE